MNYRLQIRLVDPATLGRRPAVSNEIRSLDFIPGTSLRGAIFDVLRAKGLEGSAGAWLGPEGPRWSCGWPASNGCHGDWQIAVPMPKSFQQQKRGSLRRNILEVDQAGGAEAASDKAQWIRLKDRWLRVERGKAAAPFEPPSSEVDMHVALHYGRQGHRHEGLFSRETVGAHNCFVAYVSHKGPLDWKALASADGAVSLALGKRRSAGGAATLEWREAGAFWPPGEMQEPNQAVIQLMTDAVIPGPSGGYLRGLDSAAFSGLAGAKGEKGVEALKGASSFREVPGWSGLWNRSREQSLAIEAGSVWRICWDETDREGVEGWLRRIEEEGLGIRRHEGFGWVAINPTWLIGPLPDAFREMGAPSPKPIKSGPWPWPGLENPNREDLTNLVEGAARDSEKLRAEENLARVHDLTAIVQRSGASEAVKFLEQRASRENPGPWKELNETIGGRLTALGGRPPELALFYLEALKTELKIKPKKPGGQSGDRD